MLSRLSLRILCATILVCVCVGGAFVFASRRIEAISRQAADVSRRLTSVEAIYDTSECILTAVAEEACDLGEGRTIWLSDPDPDGEIRSLLLHTSEGKTQQVGRLSREASYVRMKAEDDTPEGFVSDTKTGSVEVYSAYPKLNPLEQDERLPVMVKHILEIATSTTP